VPALTAVFSKALAGGVSNVSFSALSADLGRTMYEFKFRIPPYYTLLVRSLSVLEVRARPLLLAFSYGMHASLHARVSSAQLQGAQRKSSACQQASLGRASWQGHPSQIHRSVTGPCKSSLAAREPVSSPFGSSGMLWRSGQPSSTALVRSA
jgi:predicted unusual protein kinase regulating ubiquinone biosynthesis (AarF/ABC1/UbiB family)